MAFYGTIALLEGVMAAAGEKAAQHLAGKVVEKAAHVAQAPLHAPGLLDADTIQKWLNGSVWALMLLNLFALALFLANFLYPQIKAVMKRVHALRDSMREKREKTRALREEKQKEVLATAAAAEALKPPAVEEPVAAVETVAPLPPPPPPLEASPQFPPLAPPPELEPEPIAELAPATPEEIASFETPTDIIAPAPMEFESLTSPELVDQGPPAPALEEFKDQAEKMIQEEIVKPIPAPTAKMEPEDLNPPAPLAAEPQALSEPKKFDETLSSMPARDDLMKTEITEILSTPLDATEEIPIFDPSEMDDAFSTARKRTPRSSKKKSSKKSADATEDPS